MGGTMMDRVLNLKDAVIPLSVIISIVTGALLIQSRLLEVEFAVRALDERIRSREGSESERLRDFALSLKEMNPSMKVPEVR